MFTWVKSLYRDWKIKNAIDPGWIETQQLRYKPNGRNYTPDFHDLIKKQGHIVFIYDDLMNLKPYPDFQFTHLGTAFTKHRFSMYRQRDNGTVIALEQDEGNAYARICGAVWAVQPHTFLKLDAHMENTLKFLRVRVKLLVPHRYIHGGTVNPFQIRIQPAWMYIAKPDYWQDEIDDGFKFIRLRTYMTNSRIMVGPYFYSG